MEELIKSEIQFVLMDLCKNYPNKGDLMSVTLETLSRINTKGSFKTHFIIYPFTI